MLWHTGAGCLDVSEPLYLGILNVTPDSFSDGGRFLDPEPALHHARLLAEAGAGMLDVGAESTRPGAAPVPPEEEWRRLAPVLTALRAALPHVPLSLDTRHAEVARQGLEAGVAVLNDVTGFSDPGMLALARDSDAGIVAMRSRVEGGRLVMPAYGGDGPADPEGLIRALGEVRDRLLRCGIAAERILLDPGFGFGTTFREDTALWEALQSLPERLGWPRERFCLGISRKRFVAWRVGQPELPPDLRDEATETLHQEAREQGFRVFRSHRVPEPRIRVATPEDARDLAHVHVASLRAAYRGTLPATFLEGLRPEPMEALCRELLGTGAPHRDPVWVLERGGRILGFAATGSAAGEAGSVAELHAIYLHPSAWNRGFGRALLAQALDPIFEGGFREVVLWVLERNSRARRFYESLGWIADGGARTAWQEGIALREVRYRLRLDP